MLCCEIVFRCTHWEGTSQCYGYEPAKTPGGLEGCKWFGRKRRTCEHQSVRKTALEDELEELDE